MALATVPIGELLATRVEVASGGHPLPIVLRADGSVETVGEAGTLLGVVEDPELSSAEIELFRDDTIVFYTDGITEARTRHGMVGFGGLLSAVRGCVGFAAAEIAAHIEQQLLDTDATQLRDDVALVVAQIAGGAGWSAQAAALQATTA